jgi:pyruvyltransferase
LEKNYLSVSMLINLSELIIKAKKTLNNFRPIKLFYYNPCDIKNFGDQLNIYLIKNFSNRKIIESSCNSASFVCIGSLLEQFLYTVHNKRIKTNKKPLTIWGSGFISAQGEHPVSKFNEFNKFSRETIFKAVRGKLTFERLRGMEGFNLDKCVLGDPGLLSYLLVDKMEVQKQFRVGIIPHYVDQNDNLIQIIKNRLSMSTILNINDPPLVFLNKLRSCEVVISSAMHGLIAADSLGIPNIRIKISDNLTGGDYKFKDYYSVFGIDHQYLNEEDCKNITNNDINKIQASYIIKPEQVKKITSDLLDVIPF